MKMKTLALVICMLSLQAGLLGQEKGDTLTKAKFNNSLGVAAGFTTGYGLSYRYWPKKLGIQVTFAPYSDKYEAHTSFGVAFLIKLIETNKTNFFLYEGNHLLFNTDKYIERSHNISSYNGVGIGIEFIILKRISFNLMGGYAGMDNFERIGFTGETGLYFKF
jgi:hypothetical protein